MITDLVKSLGFNLATDVQVLCPISRGLVGTRNLNTVLQQLINPPSKDLVEINRGGMILRVGDRSLRIQGGSTQLATAFAARLIVLYYEFVLNLH